MSDYKHKDNSGSAFKNNYKQSEKHPDYKGTCVIGGKTYEVALWERSTSKGEPFYSMKYSEPYKGNSEKSPQPKAPTPKRGDFAKKQETANFIADVQSQEDDGLPF